MSNQNQQQPQQQPLNASSRPNGIDRYLVMHIATTCDEHGVYVTKDSAEVIELGAIVLDASNCEELARDSVLVKPVNTPITPLCTSLTTLTWEHVRNAGTFRDAINRLDAFVAEHLTSKKLEFAFVTLDSWDLRVQLPREARDKAVVLPPYLQHSRVFDLRTEYQHWQAYHPESLPFGSSSVQNICAALEVEPVQSSAPIKHNLPFHLQALAPTSPRRAMEEAITLSRILRGLVRKSQPIHEHPDVLARPLDARADVRAFLSERSKVLHMAGLPHDTTQSELESWFTQFGGRPIAFWTLRTPDQHKPTGTGFAIFSSHEEAAESLCMNGRALNEKAIEVSPSSNRVLDRAQDILTPFPPSKNRPRPGDWTCPSCGFSNFQRRTACFRCSYPAMPGAPGADMGYSQYGYPHMMHHGGHGHHPGGHGHGHGHGPGGYGHHNQGHHNRLGGSAPFRPGDWKCGEQTCNYHNFAKNVSCLRCGAPRSQALVVADSNYAGPQGPMDNHGQHPAAAYGMGPPSMSSGPPSVAGYGGPAAYGSGAQGYPGQHQYSTFVPSGMGMAPAGPYGPDMSGASHGAPGGYSTAANNTANGSSNYENRNADASFSSNQHGSNMPPTSGPGGYSAGNGIQSGYGDNTHPSSTDPFHFLSAGISSLNMGDDGRRQASAGANKSPA